MPLSNDMDDQFRAAARWLVRLRLDGDDTETQRAFALWLEESTEHHRAYARCEALWQTIQMALSKMMLDGTPDKEYT